MARRLDRLQTLAEALRQQYRIDVVVEQVDLSAVEAVIQLHQRLRERGIAIDILINIAGHGLQGPFVDGKLDAALAMPQLDVVSLTAVTHVFAQDMRTAERKERASEIPAYVEAQTARWSADADAENSARNANLGGMGEGGSRCNGPAAEQASQTCPDLSSVCRRCGVGRSVGRA